MLDADFNSHDDLPQTELRTRWPRTVALIEAGLESRQQIGAQVYVSRDHKILADFALGESRPRTPMTPETVMIWLSSTKPIAAVALGQLQEQKKIDWDQPVASYLPEFGNRGKQGITLRHLLTHTAGLRTIELGWPETPWEEIIERVCRMEPELDWIPGERAGYHIGSSWFLLGEVVRRVDGRAYPQYVREAIFEPLGMQNSWIGMPPERYQAYGNRIGILHNTEKGELRPHPWSSERNCTACSPGGNGHGPIRELGRFYEMLLAGGTVEGVRILEPETVQSLTRRQRVGKYDETFRHHLDWGLGFIVNSNRYGARTVPYGYGLHCSEETFGHSGFQSSTGFADPERKLAVAMVLNGTPGEARHSQRFRALNTALYEDLELAAP